jgi:hypothetical protein
MPVAMPVATGMAAPAADTSPLVAVTADHNPDFSHLTPLPGRACLKRAVTARSRGASQGAAWRQAPRAARWRSRSRCGTTVY